MGLGEKVKGAIKEKVGDVTDNPELEAEGAAQQTRGEQEAAETKDRAEAKAHEKKAEALDKQQDALEN